MTNLLGNFCLTVISFGRVISFQGGSGGIIVLISHLASFLIRVVSFQRAAPLAVGVLLGAPAAATAPTAAGAAASTVLTTITCTSTVRAAAATAAQATRIAAGIASR
jgi:hypothetical protein